MTVYIPGEDALPFVALFAECEGHGARADMLLRMPWKIIADEAERFRTTCRATGLDVGQSYVDMVVAALSATRRPDGSLPTELAADLAETEAALVALAEQWRPVTDADGTCRAIGQCACAPTRAAREACPAWRWT